jgi:hypothetical protein
MNETRIAWLAGFIDGEGCFSLDVRRERRSSLRFQPKFLLSAKKGSWVPIVLQILRENGIGYTHRERRGQFEITIASWIRFRRLGNLIKDYLVIKKPLLERILSYSNRTHKFWSNISVFNEVNEMAELVDFVRAFNKGKNRPYVWTGQKVMEYYGY